MKKWGLLLAGCSEGENESNEPALEHEASNGLRVYEEALFNDEELKMISPHMDLIDGHAVRFSQPIQASASYEVWRNGKIVQEGGGHFQDGKIEVISFSIRKSTTEIGKNTLTFLYNGESASSMDIPPEPQSALHGGASSLIKEGSALAEGERKAVWGYMVTKEDSSSPTEGEDIKQADWGILIYVQKGRPEGL